MVCVVFVWNLFVLVFFVVFEFFFDYVDYDVVVDEIILIYDFFGFVI